MQTTLKVGSVGFQFYYLRRRWGSEVQKLAKFASVIYGWLLRRKCLRNIAQEWPLGDKAIRELIRHVFDAGSYFEH